MRKKISGHPIDAISVLMEPIITQLVVNKNGDQETTWQGQRQPENVDDANELVSGKDPDRYFQVVKQHEG
jgi:hypothetical protein